jgi:O-antigen/teichoic acid export membrane protein
MAGRSRFLGYLVLRMGTAGATLVSGFAQTYVFARVLDPHTFSLFILIGNLGLSLWLFDLGIAKVLYVRLRQRFLDGRLTGDPLAEEALAVTGLYALLALGGAGACLLSGTGGLEKAAGLALFFLLSALNLAWFALRNVSSATDQYLRFEALEAVRRAGHLAMMIALLLGLPFWTFLVASNLLWAMLFALMLSRLIGHGAIRMRPPAALWMALWRFMGENRSSLLNSGGYAAGEMFVYNYPAILTPAVMGLGAPTIIVDTMFKVFRGATVAFSAVGDLLAPHQTRAFQRGDRRGVVRATAAALLLGGVPALGLCGLLAFWGEPLYRLLLGPAAVMPPQATPLLVGLVLCNLVQTVANYALAHTGFFPAMARASGAISALMGAVAVAAVVLRLDVVGFMTLYAGAYAVSAATYAWLAARGPLGAEPRGGR